MVLCYFISNIMPLISFIKYDIRPIKLSVWLMSSCLDPFPIWSGFKNYAEKVLPRLLICTFPHRNMYFVGAGLQKSKPDQHIHPSLCHAPLLS